MPPPLLTLDHKGSISKARIWKGDVVWGATCGFALSALAVVLVVEGPTRGGFPCAARSWRLPFWSFLLRVLRGLRRARPEVRSGCGRRRWRIASKGQLAVR